MVIDRVIKTSIFYSSCMYWIFNLIFILFTSVDPCYSAFHDEEWGVPVHDDRYAEMAADIFLFS
jgi:hypothetical protein